MKALFQKQQIKCLLAATLAVVAQANAQNTPFRVDLNAVKKVYQNQPTKEYLTKEEHLKKKRTLAGNRYRTTSEYLGSFLPRWQPSNSNQNKSKKRLRASDATNDLSHKIVYAGPVYMGSDQTELNLIYDTNERWLSIEAEGCTGCEGTLYDYTTSTDWVDADLRVYQDLDHLGVRWNSDRGTDKACLTPSGAANQYCTDTATALMINDAEGVAESYSGFFGLNYGAQHEETQDILLIPRMFNNPTSGDQTLTKELFAIYYNRGESTGSFIDFGEADTSLYADGVSPHVFFINENDFQWNIWHSTLKFIPANPDDQDQYFIYEGWAMVSSSHEMIYIPESLGDDFEGENPFFYWLLKDRDYDVQTNNYYITTPLVETEYTVDCDGGDYPWRSLSILFGTQWLEILPDQYLIPIENSGSKCKLAFVESSYTQIVLGTRAFWGYYLIHDYTEPTLSIVATTDGGRRDLETDPGNYFTPEFYIPFDTANFIFGSTILFITFMGWFIIYFAYIDSFPDLQLEQPINDEPEEDQLDEFSSKQAMLKLTAKLKKQLEKQE